jgi:hypothetical protein
MSRSLARPSASETIDFIVTPPQRMQPVKLGSPSINWSGEISPLPTLNAHGVIEATE